MDARLASYISLTFVFAVTPGATTAVVVRNALSNGRRAGFVTAIGAAGGNACQAVMAGVGLAVLLRQWPLAFSAVRLAGALYLAWLGLRSLWRVRVAGARPGPGGAIESRGNSPKQSDAASVRQGLLANLLNPSVGTFYLAILPTFLTAVGTPAPFAVLASIHISIAFVCHVCWSTAFDRMRVLFARPLFARALEAGTGMALVWLAWSAARTAFA